MIDAQQLAIREADAFTDDPGRRSDFIVGWLAGYRAKSRSLNELIEQAKAAVAPIIEREKANEIVGTETLDHW